MEPEDNRQVGIDWEATTWEGSRRRQIERWSQLSLDEIFAAQEDMAELAQWLAATPEPAGGSAGPMAPAAPAAPSIQPPTHTRQRRSSSDKLKPS